MTTTLNRAVWEATCDKVYQCRVERGDNGEGILTVAYTGGHRPLVIHRQPIPLSYGAHHGPDDITEWQGICSDVVRYPELRTPTQ